jgi:two-component sensor histidine kinase/HAMP domain-containing protein
LVLVVLVPLLLLHVAERYQDYQGERASALEANLEMARAVAAVFGSYVRDVRRQEEAVGEALLLLRPFSPAQGHDYLMEAARHDAAMQSLSWADVRGRIVASTDHSLVGSPIDMAPWSRRARGADWIITNVQRRRGPRGGTFTMARGVRDDQGQLRGVVLAAVDPAEIEGLSAVRRGPGAAISIVDGSGWLAYGFPAQEVDDEQRDWGRLYPSVVGAALRGEEAAGQIYDAEAKEHRYLSYAPVAATHWAAGAGVSQEDVLGPVLRGLYRDLAVILSVSLGALLAATLVARSFVLPLRRLGGHARALGEGDLARRVAPAGPAEVRALAGTFNVMAEGLQARERDREMLLKVERARAKEARLLRSVQDITLVALAYLDRDFRFVHANATYARAAGALPEDLIGRTYAEAVGTSGVMAALEKARASGEAVTLVEAPRPSPTGDELTYWDASFIPVKDEGGAIEGYVVSAAEVTDKVRAREQLLAVERARADVAEELLAEINHRMKNNLMLLASVLGLQADDLPEDSAAVDPLRDAAARVSAISAVHERLYEGRSGRVELRDLLERVAELSAQALSANGMELSVAGDRVEASSKAGATISLLANELVTNAIKYGAPAADGRQHVAVTLWRREGQVILRVWGSGNPVGPAFDCSRQRGMGLRLAHLAVEGELGGQLSLRAQDGGTIAEVVLDEAMLRSGAVAPGYGIKRGEQVL